MGDIIILGTDDVDKKNEILEMLECAYSGAKMNDDYEIMCRISRAIIAFCYDDVFETPTWDKMMDSYYKNELDTRGEIPIQSLDYLSLHSPCDLCAYSPPSSMDGKPCCMCPACAV